MNSAARIERSQGLSPGQMRALALGTIWRVIRFPALAVLLILEPLVRFSLVAIALVLTLTAGFWHFAAPPAVHVPVLGMIAAAVACIGTLRIYHLLLALLSD